MDRPLLPRTLLCLNESFIETDAGLYCATWWWRFARQLAEHAVAFDIYAPCGRRADPGEARPVDLGPMTLLRRPYYRRIQDYYLRLPFRWAALRRQMRGLAGQYGLILCRMPDPAARLMAAAAAAAGTPLVLFIGGDVASGSAATEARNPLLRSVARALAHLLRRQEAYVARRAVLVGLWDAQMRPRFERLGCRVETFASPNLTADLLFRREDTCIGRPIRLLRVCQLEPVKDLETLFEAASLLVQQGRDVMVDVAGGVTRPRYAEQLRQRTEAGPLRGRVTFLGNVAFGPALCDVYRRSDVHVISSKWEGLPRCLAEARASCVPTVATAVGSLPAAIRNGVDGLLVPPGDAAALAAAVARLIDDGELRRRIIREGFALAPRSTAEHHARHIAERVASALRIEPAARNGLS